MKVAIEYLCQMWILQLQSGRYLQNEDREKRKLQERGSTKLMICSTIFMHGVGERERDRERRSAQHHRNPQQPQPTAK